MGWIALEKIKFHANHGVYEEEKIIGNTFFVDIYVESSFDSRTRMDELQSTLNYETIFHCAKKAMTPAQDLLETVAANIVQNIKFQFDAISQVRIRVRKLNPMPGEEVGSSYVEIEEDFRKICPNCMGKFSCYNDSNCWCMNLSTNESTRAILQEKFKGCLCETCLKSMAGI